MRIDIFTLFPEMLAPYLEGSMLGRAQRAGAATVTLRDLRAGAVDAHRSVDDAPFGGGAGMVLMPEPICRAIDEAQLDGAPRPLFALTPAGRPFNHEVAHELAALDGFSLLCGRYEGIDQRIIDTACDGELSLGDFVLAGGELAALAITEAVCRLLPGALGNDASPVEESFSTGLLEYPQYTRPATFRGHEVPAVLRSGDHGAIAAWRLAQALKRTIARRPDLIDARGGLSENDLALLARYAPLEGENDTTTSTLD